MIEAIRLHAAANGAKLPGSLDEIKAVPVPADPLLLRPFEYRLAGDTAHLDAPAGAFRPPPGYAYSLSIRK